MIKLLLVDDHAVVRAGYRQMLERESDLIVVGEAACAHSACTAAVAEAPDVVVMDICLGTDSGLEALRRIRTRDEGIRILVFSMYDRPVHVIQAIRAGAHGYLTKSSPPAEMIMAIRSVAAGRRYISPDLSHALQPAPQDDRGRFDLLSPREFEVVRMAVRGDPSAAIADHLHLSPKTIANNMLQIRQKLGVDSNSGLLRLALHHGLMLQDPPIPAAG